MRKIVAITTILLCAGCTTMKTYNERAQNFSNDLKNEKDPIQVIEAYKYEYKCPPKNAERSALQPILWVYGFPFKLTYEIIDLFMDFGTTEQYQCAKRDLLMEPDIKLECTTLLSEYSGEYENKSDECILYRRSEKYHKSDVDYFDYKRFLGENSAIKTDADFLKLVERYNNISECDKLSETTEAEKEACKEQRKNEIRQLAKQRIPCMELVKDKYVKQLSDAVNWYHWAINHDPNEQVRLMRALGEYEAARWMYQPVWGCTEAREKVKERITEFGEENFCTTDNWKAEMKKLGFNL